MDLKIITLNVNCLESAASRAGLVDFLRTHKPDIIALQEVNLPTEELNLLVNACGYKAFTNLDITSINARGTAILWKSCFEVQNITIVEVNRLMMFSIGDLTFVNLYAPSGRARRRERLIFFGEILERVLRGMANSLPLLMGDFNCILGNLDAANRPEQKKCPSLQQLVNLYGYMDLYRSQFPQIPGYTFIRQNSASRLDRMYVPARNYHLFQPVDILPAAFTDHQALLTTVNLQVLHVNTSRHRPVKTYWKFNNSVLDHKDFLPNFTDMYSRLYETQTEYQDMADWWEDRAKPLITTFLKQFSAMVTRERKQTKDMLYILLKNALQEGMAGFANAQDLKRRISDLLLIEAEGLKVRSRFKENLEKEKASLFHLAREKKRGAECRIEKLLINGQETDDLDKCKTHVHAFFEPLFNGRHGRPQPFVMDEEALDQFLTDDLGKLDDHDRDAMDQPFTLDELKRCIKLLPKNKSPGLCGLSNEFYKKVFHVIANDYLAVQNAMVERGQINASMRKGVTRLIPKVNGTPRVDQLRPITMLDADYNIKSRMMTQRLGMHMETLINSGQLCSREKKNILSGVHNILSTIEYVKQKQIPAALLSFDMDKAFDRCYIPYVCRVLKHMNLSDSFINIIQDMHAGISTQFILARLTDPISLTFSIRQGDAIAMLLYIVYMEPFLMALQRVCTGLRVADFNQSDEDYCDDVEAVIEKEDDFLRVNMLFEKFESCSGALLSRTQKSKVLGIGSWEGRDVWPLPWIQSVEELKIFGFQITADYALTLERNWSTLLEKFRNVIMSFNLRALDTLQQRKDVLQIYVCSRLWYKAQILPLPGRLAAQFESIMYRYLWRGKLEKLALQELHGPVKEGGLGLVDIRTKADSLFIKQACRMLSEPNGRSLSHVKYWIGLYLADYLPDLRAGPHSERLPSHYRHFKRLLVEMFEGGFVDPNQLQRFRVKDLYKELTTTLPPPKIVYKYRDLPWETIWKNINHPVLDVKQRELLFMLVHNILPTRQRLFRLNQAQDVNCIEGDGEESIEHLFCSCRRTQAAWAWMRRKIINLFPHLQALSNFEMLNLVTVGQTKVVDYVWLVANYVDYVWAQKSELNDYNIDLDKFILILQQRYVLNQKSQNKVTENLI